MLTIYESYFCLPGMHLGVTKDVLVHVAQPTSSMKVRLTLRLGTWWLGEKTPWCGTRTGTCPSSSCSSSAPGHQCPGSGSPSGNSASTTLIPHAARRCPRCPSGTTIAYKTLGSLPVGGWDGSRWAPRSERSACRSRCLLGGSLGPRGSPRGPPSSWFWWLYKRE